MLRNIEPGSRRQATTSCDVTKGSPTNRRKQRPERPPSRAPRLSITASSPTWSSAGQSARNLPTLPCSRAMSDTNWAFSRTALIFCGLRMMRASAARSLQNSSGWNSKRRAQSRGRPPRSRPLALDHAPDEPGGEIRCAIWASARSSVSFAKCAHARDLGQQREERGVAALAPGCPRADGVERARPRRTGLGCARLGCERLR